MTDTPTEIQENLRKLHAPYLEVRLRAIQTLGAIGDTTTLKKLLELLDDAELIHQPFKYTVYTEVIFSVHFLLPNYPDEYAENRIIDILSNEAELNASYRALCAEVLGYLKLRRALPLLTELLLTTHPRVAESIAFALGQIGDEEALPALYKFVNSENNLKNTAAIEEARKAIHRITSE